MVLPLVIAECMKPLYFLYTKWNWPLLISHEAIYTSVIDEEVCIAVWYRKHCLFVPPRRGHTPILIRYVMRGAFVVERYSMRAALVDGSRRSR